MQSLHPEPIYTYDEQGRVTSMTLIGAPVEVIVSVFGDDGNLVRSYRKGDCDHPMPPRNETAPEEKKEP